MKASDCLQLIGGNNKEWVPDEIKRIVKKLKFREAYSLDWRAASDESLIHAVGKRRQGAAKKPKHSWFANEQAVQLFKHNRYRNRKLIAPQDGVRAAPAGLGLTIQHDAPLFLGTLSSYAGGCEKRCNNPATFMYSSTGSGVTVYIVDGVCPFSACMFCN